MKTKKTEAQRRTQRKTEYELFEELVEENYKALQHIGNVRENPFEEYTMAMRAIKSMAGCYAEMSGLEEKAMQAMLKEVQQVHKKVATVIAQYETAQRYGYAVKEEVLAEKVERLSDELQSPKSKSFSLKNCKTPHDLIRYFHQKGSDVLYHFRKNGFQSIRHNGREYCINDVGNALNNGHLLSKPVLAIAAFYKQERSRQREGDETYRIIASAKWARFQVKLGCHRAEIETLLEGEKSFVRVRYTDINSDYARQRKEYVLKVLNRLGFTSASAGKRISAANAIYKGEEKKTTKRITELVALLASTRDIDICSSLPNHVDCAVEAFFDGVININNYLKAGDRHKH